MKFRPPTGDRRPCALARAASTVSRFGLLLSLSLAACSTSWREGSPDRSAEEVELLLGEVQNAQGLSVAGGDISSALQYKDQSVIYYADAPSKSVGGVPSLLGFYDFSWLGVSNDEYRLEEIAGARVFLLDFADGEVHQIGLVIGIDKGNGYTYFGMSGTGDIVDDQLEARLNGPMGEVVIRSWDTDGDELNSVIQLQLDSGQGPIGKIPTLFGYH